MAFCERINGNCEYADIFEKASGKSVVETYSQADLIADILEIERPHFDSLGAICEAGVKEVQDEMKVEVTPTTCGIAAVTIRDFYAESRIR